MLIATGDQGCCHLKCFGCKLHAPLPTCLAQTRPGESHTRSGPQRELRETDICPHNQLAKYLELPQNGKIMAEVSNPAVHCPLSKLLETDPFSHSTSGSIPRATLAPSRGYATNFPFPPNLPDPAMR